MSRAPDGGRLSDAVPDSIWDPIRDPIREEVRTLTAYHVPDAAGMVKLDAMENPYGLPEALQAEVARLAAGAALNRYPDPSARTLQARLREAFAVPGGADLLLGNGSDELIQIVLLATARPGAVVLAPEPTFVMYRLLARLCGMEYVGVPLDADFRLNPERLLAAVREHRPAVVFLAYPNNPTGNLWDAAVIEDVLAAAPGLVVVDEAYHAFAGRTFLDRLADHPRLLVMRTLSKLGLAGLRLGVLAGAREWLAEFDKVRLPYNINVLTQHVAECVLTRPEALLDQARAILDQRAALNARLATLPGVTVFPSDANFILFRVPDAPAAFQGLKTRGVLIKNLHGAHPLLDHCLRVTVGTPAENRTFLDALTMILTETRPAHA